MKRTGVLILGCAAFAAACGGPSYKPTNNFPSRGELVNLTAAPANLPATEPRPEKAVAFWSLSQPLPDKISSATIQPATP